MDNSNKITAIILVILLFAIACMYQTKLSQNTYLTNIYLYISAGIAVTILVSSMDITQFFTGWSYLITGLILGVASLFLIYQDNIWISHLGFILLIFIIGVGNIFKGDKVVNINILGITLAIFLILTVVSFLVTESMAQKIMGYDSVLLAILSAYVVTIIVLPLISYATYIKYKKYISVIGIIIFVCYILLDSTRNITKSKDISKYFEQTLGHYGLNYPRESIGLILDFLNLFISIKNLS